MGYDIKKLKKSVNGTDTYITPFTDDNIKPADVINNLTSTATNKPLSANQGRVLNTRINDISAIGRHLSEWDCKTGLPVDNPPGTLPYAYKNGDYYIVSDYNDSTTSLPNYRPSGSSYDGSASLVEETETVGTGMIYYYNGTNWNLLMLQEKRYVPFDSLIGDPFGNVELVKAFNTRITKLPLEPFSSTEYKFPFHIEAPVQNADSITAKFHTLVINDGTTRNEYTISLPLADPANDKAGLWSKSLSDMVDIAIECNTEFYTLSGTVTPEQYAALKACKMARVTITVGGTEIGKALATVYYDAEPPEMIKMFSVLNPLQDGSRQFSGAYLTINDGATIAGHIRYYGNDIEVQPLGYVGVTDIYGMKFNGTEYNFGVKKLGDSDVGSSTKPIYLDAGTPTECDYTLGEACEKGVDTDVSSSSTNDKVPTSLAVWTAFGDKSTVSVSATGTATDEVNYITVDGVEKKLGGGSSVITLTSIIETTWTASGEFYIQDITVTGMTSTENPIVSVVYDGTTKALVESQQTDAAKIVKMITDTDKITVYAKEQTTVALTILIKRV